MKGITDAVDPDRSRFLLEQDEKLIVHRGWTDALVVPQPTVACYRNGQEPGVCRAACALRPTGTGDWCGYHQHRVVAEQLRRQYDVLPDWCPLGRGTVVHAEVDVRGIGRPHVIIKRAESEPPPDGFAVKPPVDQRGQNGD